MARQRSDLPTVRMAMCAQHALLDEQIATLPSESLKSPTRLSGWRVAELVAHIGMDMAAVGRYLGSAPASRPEIDAAGYALRCASGAANVDERVRGMTEEARPAELRAFVHESRLEADAAVSTVSGQFVVPARLGAIGLADYLATRCVEAAVHALDLAAALSSEPRLDHGAVGTSVRVLADALADKAPGRSVEVRIPPYSAVQCVEGPRHTRGTPPNVVETDPVTWLEVATGRLGWSAASEAGRLVASGERADVSAYLPVLA